MGVENNLDKPQNTPKLSDSLSGKEQAVWLASAKALDGGSTSNNASAYLDAQKKSPFSYGEDSKPFSYEEDSKGPFDYKA